MKIGIIITPERKREKIVKALEEEKVDYEFINLIDDNWNEKFNEKFDGYIVYPPSFPYEWKNLFFKRLYYVQDKIKDKVTPSLASISMYESKVSMHDYYKVNNIPHVNSKTFFNYKDALEYVHGCKMPVVVKEDEGSGAIGVKIIKNKRKLINIIKKSFYINNGIRKKWSFKNLKSKLYPYKIMLDTKRSYYPFITKRVGFIHIQEFLEIKYEWRVIRIGDSYFGHKKLEDDNGYHSGSLNKGWGKIPEGLLNLVKEVSNTIQFNNASFDLFECTNGKYYFNEIQVVFGTSTEEQLIVNNESGRYRFLNETWVFEPGSFSRNGCNNLRINEIVKIRNANA